MVHVAIKTLAAIATAIASDGGNAFRRELGKLMPHAGDAYRDDEEDFRSHLGASVIGQPCERAMWYRWRWAHKKAPTGKSGEDPTSGHARMIRLWNRGHLEEVRFTSMLRIIGVQVHDKDEHGNQYRISDFGGHLGGACDGILVGVPDLPAGTPCLGEYKTHSEKSFLKLVEEGVRVSKPEHFAQMQTYMRRLGLRYALYMAVNKNTDELWAEIIEYVEPVAFAFSQRAARVIFAMEAPDRIRNASPGFYICKFCDYADVCFQTKKPQVNCRTCEHSLPLQDGTWACTEPKAVHDAMLQGREDPIVLDKPAQLAGCAQHRYIGSFKK